MGRKTLPTELKIASGTMRKDRANPAEPTPPAGLPEPPEVVTENEHAITEWNRIVPQLEEMGLVSKVDRPALAAYCMTYARWVLAEEKLSSGELTTISAKGAEYQSPWVGIANRSQIEMRKWLMEYGLTPSSRAGVHGTGGKGSDQNQLLAMLKARGNAS